MNKLTRVLTSAAMTAAFAMPAFSLPAAISQQQQQPATTTTTTTAGAQPAQDDTQAKTDLYNRFREKLTAKDQAAAFELGKEYLQKYSTPEDEIVKYIKNFVTKYEDALPAYNFNKLLEEKKFPEAFAAGKTALAKNPEDLKTLIGVSWAGMYATMSGKQELAAEAQTYSQKAIQLINAGKTPDANAPFANKDETLGWLNWGLGYYNLKNAPNEAAKYLYQSAQVEGMAKKDPQTYVWLAAAYQSGDYNRLSKEYTDKCAGKAETPECKAMLDTTNQVIDRIIDSYARAISYAKSSPTPDRYKQALETWQKDLTDFYKFRNNDQVTGLEELIAGATSKPLPNPAVAPVAPAPAGTTTSAPSTTTPSTTTPSTTSPSTTAPSTTSAPSTTTPSTTTAPANSTGTQTGTRPQGNTTTTAPSGTAGTTSGTKPNTTTTTRP
jgi:tetratricopeptide (TPR) repeat protein